MYIPAHFAVDAAAVDDVDFSAAAVLRTLYGLLHEHGIRLVFSEVSPGVYAQLENSGITDLVGRDAFYESAGAVVNTYRQKLGSAS